MSRTIRNAEAKKTTLFAALVEAGTREQATALSRKLALINSYLLHAYGDLAAL